MTNMRKKSVDARKQRNGRVKAAIDGIRNVFGCTAAQAAGEIKKALSENARFKARVEELEGLEKKLSEDLKIAHEALEVAHAREKIECQKLADKLEAIELQFKEEQTIAEEKRSMETE